MAKRCKHEFEVKSDYPEDVICQKCQTIWRIPDYLSWSDGDLDTLPRVIRSRVLEWKVEVGGNEVNSDIEV